MQLLVVIYRHKLILLQFKRAHHKIQKEFVSTKQEHVHQLIRFTYVIHTKRLEENSQKIATLCHLYDHFKAVLEIVTVNILNVLDKLWMFPRNNLAEGAIICFKLW